VRGGGHHIVHEDEMKTAQRPTIRERAERICNVALSLPRCQPRLCRRCTRSRNVVEAVQAALDEVVRCLQSLSNSSGIEVLAAAEAEPGTTVTLRLPAVTEGNDDV
jgi:hypothetical protein